MPASPGSHLFVWFAVVFSLVLGAMMLAMSVVSWARCQVARPAPVPSGGPGWSRRPFDSGPPPSR